MKLRKIVLHEGNEVLQQNEMKMIRGGETTYNCIRTQKVGDILMLKTGYMQRIISFFTSLVLCLSVGQAQDHIHLKYNEASKIEVPKLSSLLSEIRYVSLETTDECLLKSAWDVVTTEKYIVYNDADQCYVFDKSNGKYLRTIGLRKNQGPQGYAQPTSPLCIIGNEVLMLDWGKNNYKVYSLDDGKFLRKIPGEEPLKNTWTFEKVYPLKDSLLIQYPLNIEGKNKYCMRIRTLSGIELKRFPSTNNAMFDSTGFFVDEYEVDTYNYGNNVYFHECTSDTIFCINDQNELEPRYIIGMEDMLPTLPEIRNNEKIEKGKFVIFGKIMESNHWLLFSKSTWTDNHYLYNKQNRRLGYIDGKVNIGFINDLNGFLPFWPSFQGYGKNQKEVCSIIQAEEYLEAVKVTGMNPINKNLNFDDNPVIVIGTLK